MRLAQTQVWPALRYFEAIAPVLQHHGPDWTKQYYALAEAHGLGILVLTLAGDRISAITRGPDLPDALFPVSRHRLEGYRAAVDDAGIDAGALLNAGADDFVLPPLAMAEFVARARALARRNGGFASQVLTWGDVSLDAQAFELRTASGRVHLGNREYQMMELLMRGRGRRICAEEMARRVWGEEKAGSELIWVHMSALRAKLEKIGAQTKICTYRGQGYALEV